MDFPDFRGFLQGQNRIFPFSNEPSWVPVFRQKFTIASRDIPSAIRTSQPAKDCYRLQFPLDVATHITAHRAQGATFRDCNVLVDLGLSNPSIKLPEDATSLLYVAITRATSLQYVFAKAIFPTVWLKLGQSGEDHERRNEEELLQQMAEVFAANNGYLKLVQDEFSIEIDYTCNQQEWQLLLLADSAPRSVDIRQQQDQNEDDLKFLAKVGNVHFQYRLRAVESERHIGIDQGVSHFAISAVDKSLDGLPKIMFAKLYENLNLPPHFAASDVVMALNQQQDLLSLMQLPGHGQCFNLVNRVIVHVERMSPLNKHAKAFGFELALLLQRLAPDPTTCIVKLAHPNVYCQGGPAFALGENIISELSLAPVSSNVSRVLTNPASHNLQHSENSSSNYSIRKKMSADVFKYIVQADSDQLADMRLEIDEDIQKIYRDLIQNNNLTKLGDLGDSLLHALHDILCGTSSFRQAIPTSSSLYSNRTVAVSAFPDAIYWVATLCGWNNFVIEGLGSFDCNLTADNPRFNSLTFVDLIHTQIMDSSDASHLSIALTSMDGQGLFTPVEHIKVVIKQQTTCKDRKLDNRRAAGAFTNSTVSAFRHICDIAMPGSNLLMRNDKKIGSVYLRTNRATSQKYQVTRSTGKHTNAILSCLAWFRSNLKDFMNERRLCLNEREKIAFFHALREAVLQGSNRLELIEFAQLTHDLMTSQSPLMLNNSHARNFADLILCALSKNQQHVKAVAANYRTIHYRC